jgi:hypothetical protein
VILWNGKSIEEAIKPLLQYIGESTERALRQSAIYSLTSRSFAYPESADLKITYRPQNQTQSEEVSAKLWYNEGSFGPEKARSKDDLVYLDFQSGGIGAVESKSVKLRRNESGNVKLLIKESSDLTDRKELAGNLKDVVRYCNSDDETIAITGKLKSDPAIAFMKIYGFNENEWKVASKGADACGSGSKVESGNEDLQQHLKNFLSQTAEPSRKLVLDLRHNGGGDPKNVKKLISLLLKGGATARDSRNYLPITYRTMQISADKIFSELGYDLSKTYDPKELKSWQEQFERERAFSSTAAEEDKIFISPALPEKLIESEKVFTSPANILVWTGPECYSACEKAIMVLSDNKIAKIIGTPTAGTGMGMRTQDETDAVITTTSDTHKIVKYPNYYFGRPNLADPACESASLATLTPAEILDCRIRSISENRPLLPHYRYEESLEDLIENGKGWIDQSLKVFSEDAKIAMAHPRKRKR